MLQAWLPQSKNAFGGAFSRAILGVLRPRLKNYNINFHKFGHLQTGQSNFSKN
jgi:hypothetical protein